VGRGSKRQIKAGDNETVVTKVLSSATERRPEGGRYSSRDETGNTKRGVVKKGSSSLLLYREKIPNRSSKANNIKLDKSEQKTGGER